MKNVLGILLSVSVGLLAYGLQWGQEVGLGTVWMEGLPLAVVLGMGVRFFWQPGERWMPGIQFMAKTVLECGIVLLGAALDAVTLMQTPVALIVTTVGLVVVTIGAGYGFGRLCGLGHKLALLVASGNAICGNSAISAIAPAIEAEEKEVVLAISFTAVLGIGVVVFLPFLAPLLSLSHRQYGILAGLSVYAVPQVLAAAYPVSIASGQIGTLVKLLRVLMLGPVVVVFGWIQRRSRMDSGTAKDEESEKRQSGGALLPWFIVGFGVCALLRSIGWITPDQGDGLRHVSGWLTTGAMGSLGLMADLRGIVRSGNRVVLSALFSLGVLILGALGLICALDL